MMLRYYAMKFFPIQIWRALASDHRRQELSAEILDLLHDTAGSRIRFDELRYVRRSVHVVGRYKSQFDYAWIHAAE